MTGPATAARLRRRPPRRDAPLLELRDVDAGYGPFRALFGVSFSVAEGQRRRAARRQRRREDHDRPRRLGSAARHRRRGAVRRRPTSRACRRGASRRSASCTHPKGARCSARSRSRRTSRSTSAATSAAAASPAGSNAPYELFPRLGERRKQLAGTLSGGEQRMLALARVLVRPPRLLVVDELSLGLAPIIIDEVYATLEKVRQERHDAAHHRAVRRPRAADRRHGRAAPARRGRVRRSCRRARRRVGTPPRNRTGLITSPDAARRVPRRRRQPRLAPTAVADLVGGPSPEVLLGWTPEHRPWLSDDALRGTHDDGGLRARRRGARRPHPVPPDPTLCRADPRASPATRRRRRRRGPPRVDLAFLGTVGWGPAATAAAGAVVVEVDEDAPDLGDAGSSPARIVAAVPRGDIDAAGPRVPRRGRPADRTAGRGAGAR